MTNVIRPHSKFFLLGSLFILLLVTLRAVEAHNSRADRPELGTLHSHHVPLIRKAQGAPPLGLTGIETGHYPGGDRPIFRMGDIIEYRVQGVNHVDWPIEADLRWSQDVSCGTTTVFTSTATIQPGDWAFTTTSPALDCVGRYTDTVQLTYDAYTHTLSNNHWVVFSSTVAVNKKQGFDRCVLPTIPQMQTWWSHSPYWVANIYIGGSLFACSTQPLNPQWMQAVEEQGWSFIFTWVGPQAPCTNFRERISWDTGVAYQEGWSEAQAAILAAADIGAGIDNIIYYDMESFWGASQECRQAVASFIEGWSAGLHEAGVKSGAYGSSCSSYMSDWANLTPSLDDVWIAHWYLDGYDPDATVWGAPCLSDDLWSEQQRIRQYTGGHGETWGDLSMYIDSNVFDGETVVITGSMSSGINPARAPASFEAITIHDFGLLTDKNAWVWVGERLLLSSDGGQSWASGLDSADGSLLDVVFLDPDNGWALRQTSPGFLELLATDDSGITWSGRALPEISLEGQGPIVEAHLSILDGQRIWVGWRYASGGNFSRGDLLRTEDGGRTWTPLNYPWGEAAHFGPTARGWSSGGPAGDGALVSADGGRAWTSVELPDEARAPGSQIYTDWVFDDGDVAFMAITYQGPTAGFGIYETANGGETWHTVSKQDLAADLEPGGPLPFALSPEGAWWLGLPQSGGILAGHLSIGRVEALPAEGLEGTIIELQFADAQIGWALVEESGCWGQKAPLERTVDPSGSSFNCATTNRLFATEDGGRSWAPLDSGFQLGH